MNSANSNLVTIKKAKAGIFVACVAIALIVGMLVVLFSRAAVGQTSFEAEDGDRAGNASITDDDFGSSNGSYVTLGGGAPTPTPSPTATPSPTPTVEPNSGPHGVPGNWNLEFEDTFDGPGLDLAKWQPNWLAGNNTDATKPVNDYEFSCYDPTKISVANGEVTLAATADPCPANNGTTYMYTSSGMQTRWHYTFTYGFMEARMWLPPGQGTPQNWPAFWATGIGYWPLTGEIDVMEVLGNELCWHFHYLGGDPGGCVPVSTAGWHTFGAEWQAGKVEFYYDGVKVGEITEGVTGDPMFLIVNYGMNEIAELPSEIKVDYVRTWKRAD